MQEMAFLRAQTFKISGGSMPPDPPNEIHIHLQFFFPLSLIEVLLQPCEKTVEIF